MAGEKIVEIIQKMSTKDGSNTSALVYGEVVTISPLTIKVDSRFIITSDFILLSSLVLPQTITVTHDTSGAEIVTLWRGLIIGDVVRMLRLNQGQLFYVIEREGDLT
jgi:hypothetical protein